MSKYYKIGKLVATHGFSGEMILKHGLGKKTSLKGLTKIFLEDNKDSFIPYFLEKTAIKNETEILLKIEGFETKESCRKLLQQEIWLTEDDFKKYAAGSAPISFLGYTISENNIAIGEVIEVIEQPHQILCKVIYKNKEALIPIHQDSLVEIDKKKKIIHVDLPEGLLDIYTE